VGQPRRLSAGTPKSEWFHLGKTRSTDIHVQLVKENLAKMTVSCPLHLAVEASHNKLWKVKSIRKQTRSPFQELFQ